MKKSVKKACSIALLLTSTTALAGVNALLLPSNQESSSHTVFAQDKTSDQLTMIQIAGKNNTALVGSTYTVPSASLYVNGVPTELNQTNYKVVSPIGEDVEVKEGKFNIERIGEYKITYTATNGGKTYTAETTVKSSIGKSTIVVESNTQRILPNYVWQTYTGDLYIPKATVEFGDDVETPYTITTTITSPTQKTLTFNSETGKLNYTSLEEGTYSVKFEAKTNTGVYLNTKTVEFTVLSDTEFEKEYKKDYTLKFDYSKTVNTSADIGEEIELPTPKGKIGTTETPVFYTIEAKVIVDGNEIDVTSQTIDGNKFTAKKSYTISGKTYDITNGKYYFYYNVTDALGKKAEKTGFEISGVKDTKKPTIVVADPYDKTAATDVKDVSYKLQTNFEEGQNVILKAIYADDLADSLSDLTLIRYLRLDSQSSSSADKYTDKKDGNENNFCKDIVFNMTEEFRTNTFNADTMVDGGTLEAGTYTVYYKATDSAGNTTTENYSLNVNTSFNFTKAPKVEFKDTFSSAVNSGDKISFSAPVASDENDDRLFTQVMYKFDNETNWTILEADKDGIYSVVADKDGATSITLRAKTENDAPYTNLEVNADNNIGTYAGFKYGYDEQKILIKNNQDSEVPQIVSLGEFESSYNQNDEIAMPTLSLSDDLVDYVNVNIVVNHVKVVDEKNVYQEFPVEDAVVARAGNTYSISNAKFYATLAGNYEICYIITDAGNNKIYIYEKITVSEQSVVDEPRFSNIPEELSEGKLELGKTLTLPVPEITGAGDNYNYTVTVNGPVGYQLNKESFTPSKAGTYTVVYKLWVNGAEVESERKEFKVEVTDSTNPDIRVEWELKDSYKVDSKVLIPVFSANDISGIDLESSKIVISSNSYTRTIKGSDMASLLAQYKGWLDEEERIAAGTLESHTNYFSAGNLYVTLNHNELYTVTYTAYDKTANKNSASVSYTIKVGDLVAPVLDIDDNIVASTVKIDSTLSIDISKIAVSDTITTDLTASDVSITVKNTDTSTVIKNIHENDETGKFEYLIETAGEYTVTFSVTDKAGNTKTVTRTFTVNEKSTDSMTSTEIIGTVLICVAVVVLAGVVVYFIVSKKKVDQMYK